MKQFPKGFYWGAATASYQVEGNIFTTDWAKAAEEGKVPKAGRSSDHYNRYEEDFDIAKRLGHNAHRFSIEWARIEPKEGKFDENEIEHYRRVIRALRDRNIEPFITLWHFTLPLWFSESGGFERKDASEIFARYCAFVVKHLKEDCIYFSTINEPNVYATHGYLYGAWPPFKRGKIFWKKIGKEDGTSEKTGAIARFSHIFTYLKIEKALVEAHNAAYTATKAVAPNVNVGVIKHVHHFGSNNTFFNTFKARVMYYFQSIRFMNRIIKNSDVIGVNYYRTTIYGDTKNYLRTDMDWKVAPSDIYGALMALKRYKKPIFIAEAGIADEDDDLRPQYITVQMLSTWKAIRDGVDVRGHMYWSLLDNYEWALGYEKRFGLVEIDYETLERKIRPSAYIYKEICEKNAVI